MLRRLIDLLAWLIATPNSLSHLRPGYYGNEDFYGDDGGYEQQPDILTQDVAATETPSAPDHIRSAA